MYVISMAHVFRMYIIHLLVNAIRGLSVRLVIKVVFIEVYTKTSPITNLFVLLEIDECASSPCANNGTCTDLEDGFLCHCLPEWNGTFCTETKSRCSSNLDHEKIRIRL